MGLHPDLDADPDPDSPIIIERKNWTEKIILKNLQSEKI